MKESQLMREVRLLLGSQDNVAAFRNNVGTARSPNPMQRCPCCDSDFRVQLAGAITYGLGVGSADLIACVGGQFWGFELKSESGKQTKEQRVWQHCIERVGGTYVLARSTQDVWDALHAKK